MVKRLEVFAAVLMIASCGDDGGGVDPDSGPPLADATAMDAPIADAAVDADVPDAAPTFDAAPTEYPATLAETGLYSTGEILAPGVREYTLVHQLWTDGATKRRWIQFPASTTIDTTDMSFWTYPVGTKIWKEFTRDGVRVETRFLWKKGANQADWVAVSYLWNQQQSGATAVPNGVNNAKGTQHDVPDAVTCRECHGRQPDFVLGFAAVSLDHTQPGLNLAGLVSEGLLSSPPASAEPHFPIPGTATEQAALAYLHANCGGCHHRESPLMATVSMDLRLYPELMTSVASTATYVSAVDQLSNLPYDSEMINLIESGNPANSNIHRRMNALDGKRMPPFGTEEVDTDGVAAVEAWILSLGD